MTSENEAGKTEVLANGVGQYSRAASNNDMVFIPPKTPVRSTTRETQYNTPMKGLVSKSGCQIFFLSICSIL